MTYKAILFDMNGVLVDDEAIQEEAFRVAIATVGLKLTSEEFNQYFIGKTDSKGLLDYFADKQILNNPLTILDLKHSEYNKLIVGSIKGYVGAIEFINQALERHLKIAVVTSTAREEAKANLSSLKLLSYFDAIVTGDEVVNGKPNPEGYLKAAGLLGVEPSDCIVIEDAPSGLTAAKAAGMFAVAVLNTHPMDKLADASIIISKLSANLVNELLD